MQNSNINISNKQPAKSLLEGGRIYLIGYMGVGKTTVGKKLAKLLDIGFIDLDKFIESKYYKTVPELFIERGESEFRLIEQKTLKEVSEIENVVISTGGGTPCFFDNVELMNQTGITVYIQAEPEELAARLRTSKTVRPIVSGKAKEELYSFISNHLSERERFYTQAQIIYKTNHLVTKEDVHLTVDEIVSEIKKLQK
ncbi:MAG: Shikimate kinase [Bacteroidetes bacterium ADurb.BinA174]|nr:MAG: Shikimate kinase [Bacteroidetes bacterium ADurb.BinA174]